MLLGLGSQQVLQKFESATFPREIADLGTPGKSFKRGIQHSRGELHRASQTQEYLLAATIFGWIP